MEYQLTMSKNDFNERFLKSGGASTEVSSTEQEKDNQAYSGSAGCLRGGPSRHVTRVFIRGFLKVDRLMMRSQLDAIYQGLVFELGRQGGCFFELSESCSGLTRYCVASVWRTLASQIPLSQLQQLRMSRPVQ